MTRVLITGCTGCVGSNLAAALNKYGYEVTGLCYPGAPTTNLEGLRVRRVHGDILDTESLLSAMQGIDWVFHVAAIADDWNHSPEKVYRTNVDGTRNVLAAAQQTGVKRLVFTCSAAVLGVPQPGQALMDENNPFNVKPEDWIYGHSKVLAEEILKSYVAQGLHAVSVLPTAIMGPGDLNFISGQMITRVVNGEIFPFPDGGVNFIDVRDVAEAHINAALHGQPGERYLLGGHNYSHLHCLGTISDVLGLPVNYIRIPNFAVPAMAEGIGLLQKMKVRVPVDRGRILLGKQHMYYNNQKAKRELGLKIRSFEETIRDTFQFYRDQGLFKKLSLPAHYAEI
jgi:dihydroflavonol-4-reductase